MTIAKNFPHAEAEQKWYKHWQACGYFHSTPDDRTPYTIVMPPPNVTGILHMGHALNNSVQDILIRRAKSQGYNTCWVPGTDHASIATEAKVVAMLKDQGIDKNALTREAFLEHAWQWKEKYGGIILEQLKRLGCSLDWDRTHFTMDDAYYKAVIRVFVELYNKGKIYRGARMINWDPQAKTALSDEEVNHKESQSKLYYVRYKISELEDEYITVATSRPETIPGDTAVCVHPDDARYSHLKGMHCTVPVVNRQVPIIFDEYIDMEFGTGALKVTPAHDINDYNLGHKHKLAIIDTLNEDGTLSEAAGVYIGEDRFVVRKKIVEEMRLSGALVKEEDYINQVGISERTNAVIEPRLSMQWWCNIQEMAKPALATVVEDTIAFFPPKYKNLYKHWMENVKDWCVSRQLMWGQRIPAWYDEAGNVYVAETEEEALKQSEAKHPGAILTQDEDVLDTWFSSWLWPMQVFGWNDAPNNAELAYYYPTTTLVTAPEIIFFWVARMIMAGHEFKKDIPFKQVYFTGIVRDKQGRKMSKQLGNSPDLLQLIDEHGTDAVRFSVMIASPAGNDLLYDEGMLEQGRNFCNKMWNAMKLIKSWEEKTSIDVEITLGDSFAIAWMKQKIAGTAALLEEMFAEFKLSEALKGIYSLIWTDFCSWFLEWVKPAQDAPVSLDLYEQSVDLFEQLIQMLHPFLPFVTEDMYHLVRSRKNGDDLMIRQLPTQPLLSESLVAEGQQLQDLITAIRDARVKNGLKPKDKIDLLLQMINPGTLGSTEIILQKQVNATSLSYVTESPESSISIVCGTTKVYILSDVKVDTEAQRNELEKDLVYFQGFLQSVEKKLGNEKFMANAKANVLEGEQKKKADALAKIKAIEESLAAL